METRTKEKQNQGQIREYGQKGPCTMGPWTSNIWRHDPRHLLFLLARYKFVARMLEGRGNVLEVGCGDAFGTAVVLQSVRRVHAVDFEPLVVQDAATRYEREGNRDITFSVHDVSAAPVPGKFDGAYALDVIEHVLPRKESRFVDNICASLDQDAILILGTPNVAAQQHASAASRIGHINLKSAETLRRTLLRRFRSAFVFSMNDEIVHTGFYSMAHYVLAMGVGLRGSTQCPRKVNGRIA